MDEQFVEQTRALKADHVQEMAALQRQLTNVREMIEAQRVRFAETFGLPRYKDKVLVNGKKIAYVRNLVIRDDLGIYYSSFFSAHTKTGEITLGYSAIHAVKTIQVLARYSKTSETWYSVGLAPEIDINFLNSLNSTKV